MLSWLWVALTSIAVLRIMGRAAGQIWPRNSNVAHPAGLD